LLGAFAAFEWYSYTYIDYDYDHRYLLRPPYREPKKGYIFKHYQNTYGHRICTNQEGHRDVDVDGNDQDAQIVIIGGSNIFGFRLPYEKTLAWQLESRFGVKVCNLAVIGSTSDQARIRLQRLLSSGKWPDVKLCIISFGINDASHQTYAPFLKGLTSVSFTFSYLARGVAFLNYKFTHEYVPVVPLDRFEQNIETMTSECKSRGIRTIVFPDPIPFRDQVERLKPEVTKYFESKPFFYKGWVDSCQKRHDEAKLLGWDRYYPVIPSLPHTWYLDYEAYLINRVDGFDINSLLDGRDYRNVFLTGSLPGELGMYPDHCHLDGEGWIIVSDALEERIRNIWTDAPHPQKGTPAGLY
jgi:lysophospholipase L1-like esterase